MILDFLFLFIILLEIVLLPYFTCNTVPDYLSRIILFNVSSLIYNDEHTIQYSQKVLNIQELPSILDVMVFTITATVYLKLLKV